MRLESVAKFHSPKSPMMSDSPRATASDSLSGTDVMAAMGMAQSQAGLPMIDRGDIRQAIDRCSNIWASLPGAGYGQFEHKADSLIAKFKEVGGTVREIEV